MIEHTGIGVADVARSAAFYDTAPGALGLRRVMQLPDNDGADGVGYGVDYPIFWIDREAAYSLRGPEPRRGRCLPRGRPEGGRDR
jgi:catechol 2,3-dioxygenase-like lactoylglutathione lyase family enzyme